MANQPGKLHSNWHHFFPELTFLSKEFYDSTEEIIKKNKIPDIKVSRVKLSQGNILSANREYLRIKHKEYIFDVCAAPHGTGFFVSWWLGEKTSFFRELLSRIPVIGPFFEKIPIQKTYYEMDTENMFKEGIHSSITEAMDLITKSKGTRGLTDLERLSTQAGK